MAQSKSKIQYEALRASRDNQKATIIYQALTHSGKAQVKKPKELHRNRLPGDPAIWQEACSREWGDWVMHEAVELEPHPEQVDPTLIMPMRHLYVGTRIRLWKFLLVHDFWYQVSRTRAGSRVLFGPWLPL